MHDSFNLAWKLNLVIRGLAKPSLLGTYEEERRKIANDLINFDVEHCKAFEQGETALAKNFDENIRFISGVGAEYSPGLLSLPEENLKSITKLRPGMLQLPAKVTRYIDANPVDIQLDIPLLGQFRVYLFVPDVQRSLSFLSTVCESLSNDSKLDKAAAVASQSYLKKPRGSAPKDEFISPQRYSAVSEILTYAMVTRSARSEFEISDLPQLLQDSRWTLYLDDMDKQSCTDKWFGEMDQEKAGIAIVRPDGYCGAIQTWELDKATEAGSWIEQYFHFMA